LTETQIDQKYLYDLSVLVWSLAGHADCSKDKKARVSLLLFTAPSSLSLSLSISLSLYLSLSLLLSLSSSSLSDVLRKDSLISMTLKSHWWNKHYLVNRANCN